MTQKVISEEIARLIDDLAERTSRSSEVTDSKESDAIETLKKIVEANKHPTAREIEEACTRLVTIHGSFAHFYQKISTSNESEDLRAYAAVAASIGFRRKKRREASIQAAKSLAEIRPQWLFLSPLIKHLESLNYFERPSMLQWGLELSTQAAKEMPDNSGVRHAHAQFLLENAIWNIEDLDEKQAALNEALNEVDVALALQSGWSKFHLTRGRILLRLNDDRHAKGLAEIEAAISTEKVDTMDNPQRILSYQVEMSLEELRQESRNSVQDFKKIEQGLREEYEVLYRDSIREQQNQMIVVIAFMTSIVALLQFGAAAFSIAEKDFVGKHASFYSILLATGSVGIVLFSATFFGAWLLRSKKRSNRR